MSHIREQTLANIPSASFADLPLPQLHVLYTQIMWTTLNGLQVFISHLKGLVSTIAPPYTSRRSIKCHLNEVYLLRNLNRTSSESILVTDSQYCWQDWRGIRDVELLDTAGRTGGDVGLVVVDILFVLEDLDTEDIVA